MIEINRPNGHIFMKPDNRLDKTPQQIIDGVNSIFEKFQWELYTSEHIHRLCNKLSDYLLFPVINDASAEDINNGKLVLFVKTPFGDKPIWEFIENITLYDRRNKISKIVTKIKRNIYDR